MKRPGPHGRDGAPPARQTIPSVIIDGRMVGSVPNGIARYVTLLARGLAQIGDTSANGLPYRPVFLAGREPCEWTSAPFSGFSTHAVRSPFLHPRELTEIPSVIRRIAHSNPRPARTLFHSPSFSSLLFCPVPRVVTVHDLIHLRFGTLLQRTYYRMLVRPSFRGAAARLTVSRYSRGEIARWAKVPESSIEVVPTAVDPALSETPDPSEARRILESHGLEAGRFFFCVSNPKPHKNMALLIEAYRRYHDAASTGFASMFPLVINVPGYEDVPGVRYVKTPNAADIRTLFTSTTAFFSPSRHEGFGLPPLEAAVSGAPVVLSDIPPHREAMETFGGDELHWLDPLDLAGWTKAFGLAAAGKLPKPSPANRARAAAHFSTQRLGRAMDRIYRRVLRLDDSSRASEPARQWE